jgi:hypothetical protein
MHVATLPDAIEHVGAVEDPWQFAAYVAFSMLEPTR